MSVAAAHERVARLTARTDAIVADVRELVAIDSPTDDPRLLAQAAEAIAALGERRLGLPAARLEAGGLTHLRWGAERPRVLLLGHYDTVWPAGTPARRPAELYDGCLFGPGSFDMKAGIAQGWQALLDVGAGEDVALLLTADEERGGPTSGALLAQHAADAEAVLVLEPSARGALKVARHGVTTFTLTVHGRAAHAGLDPARGVNAFVELARQVTDLVDRAGRVEGITVTPSTATGGHAANVVPALASCTIDVRSRTQVARRVVGGLLEDLRPHDPRASIEVAVRADMPPLEATSSRRLFALAERVAAAHGLAAPEGAEVGGGSDGNRTAALGVETLDGLGAVGDGAHAEEEHVVVAELPRRAALVAGLIEALRAGERP